ncbi:transporter substrate-binding domain-containing protein [Paucibacter sp. R3-3]|uniref:Transporter substrate-binding domain-containing protein n=1 Tax=Roseateles agri TaxID=3098619 RepID=A0ABU5DFR1_9BURK|nr:transporter substrate-binding domain-containing protein [Paucibacter sp. R3-3]MDY0745120.1 transporter substrate-binding domain-containing protein [Paucibacter sp. R3-3]
MGTRWAGMLAAALLLPLLSAFAADTAPPIVLRTVQQSGAIGKYGAPGEAQMPGLCREILTAIERIDPRLHFTGLATHAPLRRIERMLAQDEIDVFLCLLKSPEREKQWRYLPVPLYRIRHVLVQRIDDPAEYRSLVELAEPSRRKPVLVGQGTLLRDTLTRAGVASSEPPSEREALKMLAAGRSDAVYGQDVNLLRMVRESGLADRLRVAPTSFYEEYQYAVVSQKLSPELQLRLTQDLQQLEREGTLRALADKYK